MIILLQMWTIKDGIYKPKFQVCETLDQAISAGNKFQSKAKNNEIRLYNVIYK